VAAQVVIWHGVEERTSVGVGVTNDWLTMFSGAPMIEVALEICRRAFVAALFWGAIGLLVTPMALLVAFWQRGPYWQNVRANYVKAFEFCDPTTFL
jgi:hypothetical protein